MSLYDILDAKDPIVHPAEGFCHQQVTFRLVMFKPFVGEVLVGKLMESTEQGIKLSVKFFDDIYVPSYLFPKPSVFDHESATWIWKFDKGESVIEDFPLERQSKVIRIFLFIIFLPLCHSYYLVLISLLLRRFDFAYGRSSLRELCPQSKAWRPP